MARNSSLLEVSHRGRPRSCTMSVYTCQCGVAACSWNTLDERELGACPAYLQLKTTLQNVFNHDSFRPGQLDAVLPVLHGRDVLCKMATGAGKSLCFFLVPLAAGRSSTGVIISPLNALMEQQVCLS